MTSNRLQRFAGIMSGMPHNRHELPFAIAA